MSTDIVQVCDKVVFNSDGDVECPTTAVEFSAWLDETLRNIPEEYRDKTILTFNHDDEEVYSKIRIDIFYRKAE